MKVGHKWFIAGAGLFTILSILAIAPAAERIGFNVTGEGAGQKKGVIGAAPNLRVPVTRDPQAQGRTTPSPDSQRVEDDDLLGPVEPTVDSQSEQPQPFGRTMQPNVDARPPTPLRQLIQNDIN